MKLLSIGVILLVTLAVQAQIHPIPLLHMTTWAKYCVTRVATMFMRCFPRARNYGATKRYISELPKIIEKFFIKKMKFFGKELSEQMMKEAHMITEEYRIRFLKRKIFIDSPRTKKFTMHREKIFVRNMHHLLHRLNMLVSKYAMKTEFWTKDK